MIDVGWSIFFIVIPLWVIEYKIEMVSYGMWDRLVWEGWWSLEIRYGYLMEGVDEDGGCW